MGLPRVTIDVATAGEPPQVTVDGQPVPGVVGFYLRQQDGALAVVGLELRVGTLAVDLPAGISAPVAGGGATGFIDALDPTQLEQDILTQLGGLDGGPATTGEAAKAALAAYAADYDDQ